MTLSMPASSSPTRFVACQVQVVYDELVAQDDFEGVEITPLTREVVPPIPLR
jgi:hypothetical protein